MTIEDEVFIGHGVMFTNDLFPRATTTDGYRRPRPTGVVPTLSSGAPRSARMPPSSPASPSGAGAGRRRRGGDADVPDYAIVAGVPARVVGDVARPAND